MLAIFSSFVGGAAGYWLYYLFFTKLNTGHGVALTIAIGAGLSVLFIVRDAISVLLNIELLKKHIASSNSAEAAALLQKMEQRSGCAIVVCLSFGIVAFSYALYYSIPWTTSGPLESTGKGIASFFLALVCVFAYLIFHTKLFGWQNVLKSVNPSMIQQLEILKDLAALRPAGTQTPKLLTNNKQTANLENLNEAIKLLSKTLDTDNQPGVQTPNLQTTAAPSTSLPPAGTPPLSRLDSTPNKQTSKTSGTNQQPSHIAFISHSSNDSEVANRLCSFMESDGIDCWIAPRNVIPGVPWGEALVEAIAASKVFVLLLSKNSNDSPQVQREVERAVSKGIPVIPFRIENVPPSKSMEYFISSTHWLDAFSQPIEFHCEHLAEVIHSLMGTKVKARPTGSSSASHTNSTSASKGTIYVSLLDAVCCVMMADGKADPSEEETIAKLMSKIKSPLSDKQIQDHIEHFYVRIAKSGFSHVLEECVNSTEHFKSKGNQDVLIRFLNAVAMADGNLDSSESAVIDRFKAVLN